MGDVCDLDRDRSALYAVWDMCSSSLLVRSEPWRNSLRDMVRWMDMEWGRLLVRSCPFRKKTFSILVTYRFLTLLNGKLHLSTVKNAFNLKNTEGKKSKIVTGASRDRTGDHLQLVMCLREDRTLSK